MRRNRPSAAGIPGMRRLPTNARELAFQVLTEHAASGAFATDLLERLASQAALPADDRRLATELTLGVVRRQATLDALIQPHVQRPRVAVEPPLWILLQLGTYQLVFLTAVPPHAAVHETVEVAKRLGTPRWSGFLNGVLRSISRVLTDTITTEPSTEAVPLTQGRYRQLQRALLPDPATEPANYFAAAFSFPHWLAERWARRFGFDDLLRMGFWLNAPPPLFLRVNLLKTSREQFLEALQQAGIAAQPGERLEAVSITGHVRIESLPGYADGWFSVQDLTAMRAAPLLQSQPGNRVLDLCAAPGTKTTHLAELLRNTGQIVATDIRPNRLELVAENSRRLGLDIIQPRLIRPDLGDVPAGPFDAVLVDVPCSNTGVLNKRPEARWRITPANLEELSQIQRRLLESALDRVGAGGRVVYSTCSIEPEENRQVIEAALRSRRDVRLIEEHEYLPGTPADGGYQALVRRGSVP